MNRTLLLLWMGSVLACNTRHQSTNEAASLLDVRELVVPASESLAPNLFIGPDDQAYLSWVEVVDDSTNALRYSLLEKDTWGKPVEVARGTDWFVNWADFPSLARFDGKAGALAAHWLQKSAMGTFDYDVRIALSSDEGASWGPGFKPHTDGKAAEHGFVSLLPLSNGRMAAVWLDGRNTKARDATTDHDGHGGSGAMTLRSAEFDSEGKLFEEAELDARICDCCQTDAALSAAGPVVVYRDRSEGEVRDISIVRKIDGKWTAPQSVHHDNWEITGCPVNGPAIAAQDKNVAVAWFTGAGNEKQVLVAFSEDAGQSFSDPIRIDDSDPLGRVDIVFVDAGTALVSWIENTEEGGQIKLARARVSGKAGESISATAIGTSRQSGFPILEKLGDQYLLAWTHTGDKALVRTMLFSLPPS